MQLVSSCINYNNDNNTAHKIQLSWKQSWAKWEISESKAEIKDWQEDMMNEKVIREGGGAPFRTRFTPEATL